MSKCLHNAFNKLHRRIKIPPTPKFPIVPGNLLKITGSLKFLSRQITSGRRNSAALRHPSARDKNMTVGGGINYPSNQLLSINPRKGNRSIISRNRGTIKLPACLYSNGLRRSTFTNSTREETRFRTAKITDELTSCPVYASKQIFFQPGKPVCPIGQVKQVATKSCNCY